MNMNEFIPIKNNKDIKRFLDETNSLHDGYIISVNYSNNSITRIDGGYRFALEATKLSIRILVTSLRDAIVELYFEDIIEWQIFDNLCDITDTAIVFDKHDHIIWADDNFTSRESLVNGSYVIANKMKWRIE